MGVLATGSRAAELVLYYPVPDSAALSTTGATAVLLSSERMGSRCKKAHKKNGKRKSGESDRRDCRVFEMSNFSNMLQDASAEVDAGHHEIGSAGGSTSAS